jgi:hypothetical protein
LLDRIDRDQLLDARDMGVWGTGTFDNDAACDWSSDLADASDLTYVTDTLSSAQEVDDDELDVDLGCAALAACEVVASLQGRGKNKIEVVDEWVRSHPSRLSSDVIRLATNVLDRVAQGSELAQMWRHDTAWKSQLVDLRRRVAG